MPGAPTCPPSPAEGNAGPLVTARLPCPPFDTAQYAGPDDMAAGYSGTPQPRKLGLKPGQRVGLDRPPSGWHLSDPPPDLAYVEAPESADIVISFFTAAADLPLRLPDLVERIYPSGALWIAWPRRAGGHHSDITDNIVRAQALPLGVVDVKVAAIDEDWSGQRLVWRLANRDQLSQGDIRPHQQR